VASGPWLRTSTASLIAGALLVWGGSAASATQTVTPNDPSYGQQWGLANTGQTVGGITGTAGADVDASEAWAVTTGSVGPVVVVLDSGVQLDHSDLVDNLWTNTGGVGGCPAGTHGYNVVPTHPTCDPTDDNGHGTHVAGIIAAAGNNGVGVAGVAWQTTILPVKFAGATGSASNARLLKALDWILQIKQQGVNVRVVNDSETWKKTAFNSNVQQRLASLAAAGILFVTASGNNASNDDTVARYPCSYRATSELCVGATTQNDAWWSKSNYGTNTVDLAAPGVNILSTTLGGGYGLMNGTSMAAAFVSGAAALAVTQDPTLTVADLKQRVLAGVDVLSSLATRVRTSGRLNACLVLTGCPLP
jgi:subtilisin family serine protease